MPMMPHILFSRRAVHVGMLHSPRDRFVVNPSQCFGAPGEQVGPYLEFQGASTLDQPSPEDWQPVLIRQGYEWPGRGLGAGNDRSSAVLAKEQTIHGQLRGVAGQVESGTQASGDIRGADDGLSQRHRQTAFRAVMRRAQQAALSRGYEEALQPELGVEIHRRGITPDEVADLGPIGRPTQNAAVLA